MAKIEKTKTGYRVRVSTGERQKNGSYKYVSLFAPTKAEVRRLLSDFEDNREKALAAYAAGRVTLAKAMDDFLDTCRSAGRSPSTIRGYVTIRRNSFPALEERPLSSITRADVQATVNGWVADGATPKSVQNRLAFLSAVMRHADVEPPLSKLVLPEKQEKELTLPQDEDVQRALFYLNAHNPKMYLAVVIAATLGLRRGEIAALTMDDFDFDAGTVSVTKSVAMDEHGQLVTKQPKSRKSKRVIRGVDSLVLNAVKRYGQPAPAPLVGLTPNAITMGYIHLRERINVPGRFHDLRHYAASVMAALGVPLTYAQERMGHATLDMLNRVYLYTLDKKRDAVADQIASHNAAVVAGDRIHY